MKKIEVLLDYGTKNVFVIDELGHIINDDELPEEAKDDEELNALMNDIAEKYTNCYINNETTFEYKGFDTPEESKAFSAEIRLFIKLLRERLGDKYEIVDRVTQR